MVGLFGEYDVVIAGAGVTGVVASISARRQGASTLLVEGSGFVGGVLTAGRLTKPHGPVESGILHEMMLRAAEMGGADLSRRRVYWGEFGGVLDPEVMQRVILEMLDETQVDLLLYARITDVLASDRIRGLEVLAKPGRKIILANATIDGTGDGDVAALAGAPFMVGRPSDGKLQPITTYIRMINVDTPTLVRYIRQHPHEFSEVLLPDRDGNRREDYLFNVLVTGFTGLIQKAREAGDWTVPKAYVSLKTGKLPGEVNLNASRFQGNALDERIITRAELELRKQAYSVVDFFKKYVPGFEQAALMDIAPKLGVRETRRIIGDYVLTGEDVKSERRFPDSIALSRSGLDVHEPGGEGGIKETVGTGYGVPYRCLLPKGVEGVLIAGRCISVDEVAFGSTRNVPTCAQTGEASGVAAAIAAQEGITPRQVDAARVQSILRRRGILLGNE